MDAVSLRQILWGTAEYQEELELRNRVLRIPLGLDLFHEDLGGEDREIHIGAFENGELAGVLVLRPVDDACVKMRQVAVDERRRSQGVGRQLVAYAEELAREKGYREIRLHARREAADFYIKLGYIVIGEEFTEVGIPHVPMGKALQAMYIRDQKQSFK